MEPTIVEVADAEENERKIGSMPHAPRRVFVNGHETRIAEGGLRVEGDEFGATTVTLKLLPDEIHFTRTPHRCAVETSY